MPASHNSAASFNRRPTVILVVAVLTLVVTDGGIKLAEKGDQACVAKAMRDVDSLWKAVELRRLSQGRLPESLNELEPEMVYGIPTDPWGNEYTYVPLGPIAFDIVCLGADGAAGGEGFAADLNRELAREWLRSHGTR